MTLDATVTNNYWELQSLGPPQHQQHEHWDGYVNYIGVVQPQSPTFPIPGVLGDNSPGSSPGAGQTCNKGLPAPPADWDENATTVMIRNLPNKYTQQMLLRTLQESGFRACVDFDFFYLPMDRGNGANLGYGFVNFVNAATAGAFASAFQGRHMRRFNSRKTIDVMPALIQGYEANHQHYSGTRVAHADNHQCRPLFLREGGEGGARPTSPTDKMPVQESQIARDTRGELVQAIASPESTPSRRRRRASGRRVGRNGRSSNGARESSPEAQADDTDSCIKGESAEDTTRMRAQIRMEASWSFSDQVKPDVRDLGGDSDYRARFVGIDVSELDCGFATPERQVSVPQDVITPAGLQMAWSLLQMEPSSPPAQQPDHSGRCYSCHNCGFAMQPNFLFCPNCATAAPNAPNAAQLLMMHPR